MKKEYNLINLLYNEVVYTGSFIACYNRKNCMHNPSNWEIRLVS